jgi:two-component system chemotaxis sensor kinase CheA
VETPEARLEAGKDAQGHIRLAAYRDGSEICLEIADDGKGLDPEVILEKARSRGIARPDTDYPLQDILAFILEPGFSTASRVSDISGRGVGLDVVARAIQKIGGSMTMESEKGRGSVFRLRLPRENASGHGLSDGIVARTGKDYYVVPTRHVREIVYPLPGDVVSPDPDSRLISVRGVLHAAIYLHDLENSGRQPEPWETEAMIVEVDGRTRALLADAVLGRQHIVARGLDKRLLCTDAPISGFAIMGEKSGLVLDIEQMLG